MKTKQLLVTFSLLSFLLAVPSAGQAAQVAAGDDVIEESPKRFVTGISFGGFWINDANIQAVYGDAAKFATRLTFGFVPVSRYIHLETNISVGFLQFLGSQVFVESSESSSDKSWMTIFPFNVDLLVGIDIADEQPVVPYGGIGFAWTLWREHETGGGQEWAGDRFGLNAFFGLALLLDRIELSRARRLDADSGINDAYLTLEGRWADVKNTLVDGELSTDGLDFSGWSFQIGLKLTY